MSELPRDGRLLAVDWGTKRIGLAISDPSQTVATPLGTLTRRAGRRFPMGQLRLYVQTHQPVGVVVGLPLDASGTEGAPARAARDAGDLIATKTGLPVTYWDERMTTARLQRSRREVGGPWGRRSRRAGATPSSAASSAAAAEVDPLAATLLLQAYLDHRRA